LAGTFYTSKLTSGKETTLSALSELLKSTAVVVDQIDSRTEDILTTVQSASNKDVFHDEEPEFPTIPTIPALKDSTNQIFSKKT